MIIPHLNYRVFLIESEEERVRAGRVRLAGRRATPRPRLFSFVGSQAGNILNDRGNAAAAEITLMESAYCF